MPKRIMIVDDEKNLRELVKAIFNAEGIVVIEADSGKECLKMLKTEKPDLILMDIMMPRLSGIETIKKIRKNPKTKRMKIIFLTVMKTTETAKSELSKLNVLDYIVKPFNIDDLVKRVKTFLS
ncbi:response regulator [Candidatus Woesearchaeota archaeon]|nr:response regulator [Candidatus Woesearchaeota archaeon]